MCKVLILLKDDARSTFHPSSMWEWFDQLICKSVSITKKVTTIPAYPKTDDIHHKKGKKASKGLCCDL